MRGLLSRERLPVPRACEFSLDCDEQWLPPLTLGERSRSSAELPGRSDDGELEPALGLRRRERLPLSLRMLKLHICKISDIYDLQLNLPLY